MSMFKYLCPKINTEYQVMIESGERTTIVLNKGAADVLQRAINNVHEFLGELLISIQKLYPDLSRRQQGDMVREKAEDKAYQYPEIMLKELGWNKETQLDALF